MKLREKKKRYWAVALALALLAAVCFERREIPVLAAEIQAETQIDVRKSVDTNVTLNRGKKLPYPSNLGDYSTSFYTVNGKTAYCLEPAKGALASGTYAAKILESNKDLRKILYYGYQCAGDLTDSCLSDKDGDTRYIFTHLAAGYVYAGEAGFIGCSYEDLKREGVIDYINFLLGQPEPPSPAVSFNKDRLGVTVEKGIQTTESMCLTGDERNSITLKLPESVTYHTDKNSQTGGEVTVPCKTTFWFTAPLEVTGKWESGNLSPSIDKVWRSLVISDGGGKQDIGYGCYESTVAAPISFCVDWKGKSGTVNVYKHGEVLSQVQIEKESRKETFTNDAQNVKFIYKDGPLEGVTFRLEVKKSIYEDGKEGGKLKEYQGIPLEEGAVAARITTDATGHAKITGLPLGTYVLKEEGMEGDEYLLNSREEEIVFTYEDSEAEVVVADTDYENARVKVKLSLTKRCKSTRMPIAGAVFGLYNQEDIKNRAGEIILKKDSLIEKQLTNEKGSITFVSDLPMLQYYLKELMPAPGYLPDDEIYPVEFLVSEEEKELQEIEIEAWNVPTIVEIKKLQGDKNTLLKGAKLQVLDENGKVLESWTSDEEAHRMYAVPAGTYQLHEEESPTGFALAEDVLFTVEETEEIQQVEVRNEKQTGKIVIEKVDNRTNKSLKGAVFTITEKDSNRVVGEITTNSQGTANISNLPVADYAVEPAVPLTYVIKEKKSPKGYQLTTEETAVQFTLENKEKELTKTVTISNQETPKTMTLTNLGSAGTPKTGDMAPIEWYLAAAGVVLGILLIVLLRRDQRKKDKSHRKHAAGREDEWNF